MFSRRNSRTKREAVSETVTESASSSFYSAKRAAIQTEHLETLSKLQVEAAELEKWLDAPDFELYDQQNQLKELQIRNDPTHPIFDPETAEERSQVIENMEADLEVKRLVLNSEISNVQERLNKLRQQMKLQKSNYQAELAKMSKEEAEEAKLTENLAKIRVTPEVGESSQTGIKQLAEKNIKH